MLLAGVSSAASCGENEKLTELGCIPTDPVAFVGKFYGIGLSLIGGIALLFIIYGGYIILTSQGNPLRLDTGRSYVYYAIAGVLFAILGFVFIQIVVVNILHIPGFR